jgi:two-component system NtrC family sensor kinase
MAPTVLLVEDNPDHAVFALKALRNDAPTAKVVWAKDGEEALAFLGHGPQPAGVAPQLILLDIHLPKVDGREVLRRVKGDERLRAIPVIMLTEARERAVERQGLESGADAYISKSAEQELIILRIRALLRRRSAPVAEARDAAGHQNDRHTRGRNTSSVPANGTRSNPFSMQTSCARG